MVISINMFIYKEEIGSAVPQGTIDLITDNDEGIVQQCIDAAIEEVKSYLRGRYDTEAIFAAEGSERSPLMLDIVKTVTVWNIIRRSNAQMVYDIWQDRYDRAVRYLKDVSKGTTAPDLPIAGSTDGTADSPIKLFSNPKFNHYF